MNWSNEMRALRNEFKARSSRCTPLRHFMLVAHQTDVEAVHDRYLRASQSELVFSTGSRLYVPRSFQPAYVFHVVRPSGALPPSYEVDDFRDMADAAARLLLVAPDPARALFAPPAQPDPILGVANDSWLSTQWIELNRDKLLESRERIENGGGDPACIHVPECSCRKWRINDEGFGNWCIAMHNLAWRSEGGLRAPRSTWKGNGQFKFASADDLHFMAKSIDASAIPPLPLRWLKS